MFYYIVLNFGVLSGFHFILSIMDSSFLKALKNVQGYKMTE